MVSPRAAPIHTGSPDWTRTFPVGPPLSTEPQESFLATRVCAVHVSSARILFSPPCGRIGDSEDLGIVSDVRTLIFVSSGNLI